MRSVLKCVLFGCVALLVGVGSVPQAHAGFTYVGSWDLATLPDEYFWGNNPTVYSAVEAAAHLFGGSASDYAISTIDSDPLNINNLAFVDGWADTQYLLNPASETFSFDGGAPGYNDPAGFGTAYSALVRDHAPSAGPIGTFVNYAFRIDTAPVPEPASIAMWGLGIVGMGFGVRRRNKRGQTTPAV